MPEWTFLTNHAVVLSFLAKQPRITALELSSAIGITERAIRKIIADLYAAGYIDKTREGRRINYRINPDLPLRHHTHCDIVIGDFLKALGWQGRRRRRQAAESGDKPLKAGAELPGSPQFVGGEFSSTIPRPLAVGPKKGVRVSTNTMGKVEGDGGLAIVSL